LKFNLKIKNNHATNAIVAVGAGSKNYAVNFYFAYATVTDIGATTSTLMTNTGTAPALEFGLAAAASSTSLLAFETSATLPTTNCASYNFFCACVSTGAQAIYTDGVTNNNCGCTQAKTTNLISCSAGK
jgi:hypothetical protein